MMEFNINMMDREEILRRLSECFSVLHFYINQRNAANYHDIDIAMENFICGFMNRRYGFRLKNANRTRWNEPVIDLKDDGAKIAVQVTADNNLTKLRDTVRKFEEYGLYEQYRRLIIVLCGERKNYRETIIEEAHYSLNVKDDVLGFTELVYGSGPDETEVDIEIMRKLYQYVSDELPVFMEIVSRYREQLASNLKGKQRSCSEEGTAPVGKPTVFISYNWQNKEYIDRLCRKLENQYTVIRDKSIISPWDSIADFMKLIRAEDIAVLSLTEGYLRSLSCMTEVCELMEDKNWLERTRVIISKDVKNISNPLERLEYTFYWKKVYEDLSEQLSMLPESARAGQLKNLEQIERIIEKIDFFLYEVSKRRYLYEEEMISDDGEASQKLRGLLQKSDTFTKKNRLVLPDVGSTLFFGVYEQDDDRHKGMEKIEWIVLEKAKDSQSALLISRFALDCKQYNSEWTDTTWEYCSLRRWLNDDFYDRAFQSDEKQQILTTRVRAEEDFVYGTKAGADTDDRIFLLSISEVKRYFQTDSDRVCKCTKYAKANGAYIRGDDGSCRWWLRSPGGIHKSDVAVIGLGAILYDGFDVLDIGVCVRPALWIKL